MVLKKQYIFREKETGELIPVLKIQKNMAIIDNLLGKLKEGKKVYKQAMEDTGGDKDEASKNPNEVAGGSCSVLWDRLAEKKVVCALLVVCPPAQDKDAMYDNEDRVMWLIGQASEYMFKNIVDIWTSRIEIGSAKETYVYARYPIPPVANGGRTWNQNQYNECWHPSLQGIPVHACQEESKLAGESCGALAATMQWPQPP